VRSRGLGSRNPTKLGLQFDFNYYVTGQTFVGLKSIVLDNLWQDPSMIRERVAMAFFARMGQPASRESFARLFINEVFQGVYVIVEPIDSDYVSRTIGGETGSLFEYHWVRPYYFSDLGDDLSAYQSLFDPRTHETDSRSALYAPIREMVRELNEPVDAGWTGRVGRYADLEQLVRHVAVETFLSEWDGLLGYDGTNNFYLYRPAGSNRHVFIPWDRDNAFHEIDSSIFQRIDQHPLFQRVLAVGDLRGLYLSTLEDCARAAAADNWLEHEIVRAGSLITVPAAQDAFKPYTTDEHDAAVEFLLAFARTRPNRVLTEATQVRAASR
jgi:hypothetical protein